MKTDSRTAAAGAALVLSLASLVPAQLAVVGETVHTMDGLPIPGGVVLIADGKIQRVGAAGTAIPEGYRVLRARVVTPGLIDAHTVAGLSGALNQPHDQDQLESSSPLQPELRAVDAFNREEKLVEWLRGFGVTTLHTGHGPGAVISGQTMVVKTAGTSLAASILVPEAMIAATLGDDATVRGGKSPGTRAKVVALLREELVKAGEYRRKIARAAAAAAAAAKDVDEGAPKEDGARPESDPGPARDLRLEALGRLLSREVPLLVTAQRSRDILTALRIAEEFDLRIVLDGGAEAYLVLDQIRAAGVPVLAHPPMMRTKGETGNATRELCAILAKAGIPFALQSGYESYVPKTRVVLFEAAIAAANGLSFEQALAAITIDAARILGVEKRVGSLAPGKDADLALYDGDPFEYTTHCVGVVIDGVVVSEAKR